MDTNYIGAQGLVCPPQSMNGDGSPSTDTATAGDIGVQSLFIRKEWSDELQYAFDEKTGSYGPQCIQGADLRTLFHRAIDHDNVTALRLLLDMDCWKPLFDINQLVIYATGKRAYDCIVFLHKHGAIIDGHLMRIAIRSCCPMNIIRYLHENGAELNRSENGSCSARNGVPLELNRSENGSCSARNDSDQPNMSLIDLAVCSGGSVECLQYLHDHGCPWDRSAVTIGILCGNLNALHYLHDNGCPWHISMVKWAIEYVDKYGICSARNDVPLELPVKKMST